MGWRRDCICFVNIMCLYVVSVYMGICYSSLGSISLDYFTLSVKNILHLWNKRLEISQRGTIPGLHLVLLIWLAWFAPGLTANCWLSHGLVCIEASFFELTLLTLFCNLSVSSNCSSTFCLFGIVWFHLHWVTSKSISQSKQ